MRRFAVLALTVPLAGCAWFGLSRPDAGDDAVTRSYRAAMADFSDCIAAPDAAGRDAAAARLAEAAAALSTAGPAADPAHRDMVDRVSAAHAFCMGAR